MIRTTFIVAAMGVFSLQSLAQNPTPPSPAPAPVPPTTVEPVLPETPPARMIAPRAKRWESIDLLDLGDRLDNLKIDLLDVAMPDMDFEPPMALMPAMDFDMDFDLDEGLSHIEMPMEPMPPMEPMDMDMDLDIVPPMARLAPMPPMPSMVPLAPAIAMSLDSWNDLPGVPTPSIAPALARASSALSRIGGRSPFERQFGNITTEPPNAWAQSDPADSLYRLARETLNRGEYRRAAQLFGDITQRFPNSVYAGDARYWRAFALYRLGGTSDLHDALAALQGDSRVYRQASLQADAPALASRIRGALALQGDSQARAQVGATASDAGEACDREDVAVRVEALNSLGQTDPESTTPILRRVLARRDDCSSRLRRAALWLVGRRTDPDAMGLVMSSARNDPDIRVRADALRFLAAMPGDQPISTIEEIARTPGNEQLQRAAVLALGRSDSPRARQSIRAIVERTDLSENLRAAALESVDAEHTSDNGAYIRSIYPRLDTPRLKAAAIRAIASIGGSDNDQMLLSVVRNPNETADMRATALRYAGRSTLSITDLTRMYDVAGDRPLREQLIRLYAQRPDPQATDKLLEIARSGTDPDMRRLAISALSRKNDPRTKKLLLEIIDK
jgi:HEAT repeat protein